MRLVRQADCRTQADRRLSSEAAKRTQVFATGVQTAAKPLPGTLITRVYKGREIRVRVTADGFEFGGEFFRSLSAVAKHVTGSHWSGNRFFNLDKQGQ